MKYIYHYSAESKEYKVDGIATLDRKIADIKGHRELKSMIAEEHNLDREKMILNNLNLISELE